VGIFINTLPVRDAAAMSRYEWLARLQARQVDCEAQELWPTQRWAMCRRAPLLFENYPAVQSLWRRDGALRVVDVRGYQESSYPLTVVVVPRDGLWVRIKYDCRRFTRTAVERMLEHYRDVLRAFRERPEACLAEVSLLGAEERRRVLVEWNDTRTAYPRDQTLHRLFEAQAERTPDRLAVVFGDDRLTYRELNERANRVAHRFGRRGVGSRRTSASRLERSASMVVGMLAILKQARPTCPRSEPSPGATRLHGPRRRGGGR
jgi:non-ribosomal peptide synthetase component F